MCSTSGLMRSPRESALNGRLPEGVFLGGRSRELLQFPKLGNRRCGST
jgi:hypothetical protein